MRVTLRQVAERAGFSVATVHQILRGYDRRFSDSTRASVRKAAEELDYRVDMSARSLRDGRSYLVGVMFFAKNYTLTLPVGRGMQRVVRDNGCTPCVYSHIDAEEESINLRSLRDRSVDGVIVNVAVEKNGATLAAEYAAASKHMPVVEILGRFVPGACSISLDFEAAATKAVELLAEAGHQRIALYVHDDYNAFIDGAPRLWTHHEYAQGYHQAIEAAALEPLVSTYRSGRTGTAAFIEQAYIRAGQMFDRPDPPTAVVCYSDEIAEGVMLHAARFPGKIPKNLTVASFGLDRSIPTDGGVKRVQLVAPLERLGQVAAENLFAQFEGRSCESARLGPTEIIQ